MDLAVAAAATLALRRGLSIVPPREDGTKAPEGEWKAYQRQRPSESTVQAWYEDGRTGLGVVCGKVSGDLECLEFEAERTYQEFLEIANEQGLGDLVERIDAGYSELSGGGGVHWLYRCPAISGNTKLAREPGADGPKVLIETRGEGGYVILAPSNGRVHPSGNPYLLLRGGFDTIASISADERRELFALTRTFDTMPLSAPIATSKPTAAAAPIFGISDDLRPGDAYNARTTWQEILLPAGWTRVGARGDVTLWRRPGKQRGISATTGHGGSDLLWVFSTSTVFEAERSYDRFGTYAALHHHGDLEAAGKALHQHGYGDQHLPGTPYRPPASLPVPNGKVTVDLSDLEIEPVHWLWPMRVPRGKITIFEGDPETGKSTITLDIAARVTTGTAMPQESFSRISPAGVVIVCGEDDLHDTIIPRLLSHGADLGRIGSMLLDRDERGELIPLTVPEDMHKLRQAIAEREAKLLIIDPITAYLSPTINTHVDASVRRALLPLADVAQETDCAILMTRHLNKSADMKAKYRGGGSIAFTGMARSVVVCGNHPDQEHVRVMARVKNNLAAFAKSLTYEVESDELYECPHIRWTGTDPIDADGLLRSKDGRLDAPERDEAEQFLREELAQGPMLAKDVIADAKALLISPRTLARAKARLGIVTIQKRSADKRHIAGHVWTLPEHAELVQGSQT